MSIQPEPAVFEERLDYFGNPVTYFTVQEQHTELVVRVSHRWSCASTSHNRRPRRRGKRSAINSAAIARPAGWRPTSIAFDSRYVAAGKTPAEYAAPSFTARPPHPRSCPRSDAAHLHRLRLRRQGDDARHAGRRGLRDPPRRLPGLCPRRTRLPALAGPGRPLRQRLPLARCRRPAARVWSGPTRRMPGSASSAARPAGSTSIRRTTRSPPTAISCSRGAATTKT